MYYFIDILASIVMTFVVFRIWNYYGVFRIQDYSIKKAIAFTGIIFFVFAAVTVLLTVRDMGMINWSKIILVLFCVFSCAFIDFRRHIIPNKLVLLLLSGGVLLLICDFIFRYEIFMRILVSSLLGFGFFVVFLTIVSIVSKRALGFGDVKIVSGIGLVMGFSTTYSILLYSLILCAVCSVYLLVIKKKGKKHAIPFGPFVLIGFLIIVISGGY